MDHLSLLAGGREHSRAEGEAAAAAVLRKSGRMTAEDPDALVWDRLTRTTLDGVAIAPLGNAATIAELPETGLPGQAPYTRGRAVTRPQEGWDIRAHLADPDAELAAQAALTDLENGATSLWLVLGRGGIAVEDVPTVLEKVFVDLAPVALDAPSDPVRAAEALVAVLEDRGVPAAPGTSLGGDPVGAGLRGFGGTAESAVEIVGRLAGLAQRHGTSALTVDATVVHDAGASDAQELGYSLATGVAYLRMLVDPAGPALDPATAAALVDFRYAATDEQFTTIAKLRAARRLWHRVLELSGAPGASGQVQHAVTSRPMMTKYDPWVNMLRGTVAAFAAGVGGATSVTVLPFDNAIGLPDAFSRRIARNTSSLLIHESHVARVTDPGGGSYALEKLTDDLARVGWAQLQRIEAEGGVVASVARDEGGLLSRIEQEATQPRHQAIRTRKRAITGISEFPHLHESLPQRRSFPEGAVETGVQRYGSHFEAMRDEPAETPVFLATMGTVAAHTARASFAGNLLAAGGVDTVVAGATAGVEDVLAAYRTTDGPCPVVCLAGPDKAYAEWGAELVTALREAGAAYVVLAGKPDATVEVDDSCAMGVDALAFLGRVRSALAGPAQTEEAS